VSLGLVISTRTLVLSCFYFAQMEIYETCLISGHPTLKYDCGSKDYVGVERSDAFPHTP
jgi:hypothetical protein